MFLTLKCLKRLKLTNGFLFFKFSITLGVTENRSFHEEHQTDVLSEPTHPPTTQRRNLKNQYSNRRFRGKRPY